MTDNPFDKYEIDHLSPSHLNLFIESQAKWALCYLHKFKERAPAMWRGTAVEAGLVAYLKPPGDLDAAIEFALAEFEKEAMGELAPEIDKERNIIPDMVEQGSIALFKSERGQPLVTQSKVEHYFDGIEVPAIGFTDIEWVEDGLEIKTTTRMPSEPRFNHARQRDFYSVCKKKPFSILYVTPTKYAFFPQENPYDSMRRYEWAAHAIRNILSACPDKDAVSSILPPPDYDHPYLWRSAVARTAAEQIWR